MLIYNLFIEFAVDKILICDMSANWGFFFSMSKDGSHCWRVVLVQTCLPGDCAVPFVLGERCLESIGERLLL